MCVAGLVCAFAGCRTVQDILNDYNSRNAVGDFKSSQEELRGLAKDNGDDQLLWQLLLARLYSLDGQMAEAVSVYDAAEDTMIAQDQEAVFSQAGQGSQAMVWNDCSFPYDGGGQDRVFTCLYKGIDYLAQGQVDAARTEFNRCGQHQDNWLVARRKEIESAREKLEESVADYKKEHASEEEKQEDAADCGGSCESILADSSFAGILAEHLGYDHAHTGVLELLSRKDYVNAYAEHVAAVFRWITGDYEMARAMMSDVATLVPENTTVVNEAEFLNRQAQEGGSSVLRDTVWIYVEDGLCPRREEIRIDLPLVLIPGLNKYVLYSGMAFPKLKYEESAATDWTVRVGETETPLQKLSDIDGLIKTEYDVYLRGAITREIARVLIKTSTQIALGVLAEKNSGDWKRYTIFKSAQVTAATYMAASIGADTRSWSSLPKTVYVLQVKRPADGKIVLAANGAPIEIMLPEGNTMVFITKTSAAAHPTVKTAVLPNR